MEWLFIPLGFFVGVLGTLIGVGGGVILVPVLLISYPHMRPEVVTAISLAMIFGNSLSGSLAYARQRRINYKAGLVFAAAAVPGSIAGAFAIAYVKTKSFSIAFGILMLAFAIYFFLRPIKDKPVSIVAADFTPSTSGLKIGALISTFVGFLSSMLGIGGGIIHVPALIYVLGFPVHLATATSHFVLAIMTASATLIHIFDGSLDGRWLITSLIIVGVIPGAQLGAYLSKKVRSALIVRILAVTLALSAARILYMAL